MRGVMAALGAALALLIAVWGSTPPRPKAADAAPNLFSAGRAMATVRAIGSRPHPTGSADNARAVTWLVHRFAAMGVPVAVDSFPIDDSMREKLTRRMAAPMTAARGQNVLALIAGRDRTAPAIVLMAHHDSVPGSPGAADDAIGVATLVETARALRQGPVPTRDVLFLMTDGEEVGLNGSKAFFALPGVRGRIGVVLNVETRGAGGRAVMFETGAGNGAMVRAFGRAVAAPSAGSLAVTVYRRMPNRTDLTSAIEAGLPGFNFALNDRAALYHSPLATPDRIEQGSLQDMGTQALALTRALAMAPTLPARTNDVIFHDLWGSRLIIYPMWGGWVILALAGGLAGYAIARVRPGWREVARGLVVPVALLVGGGVLQFAVNRLSGAGVGANYYDRLAALPRLEVQAALVCAAVLLVLTRWRAAMWGGWTAMFGLTAVASVALQASLPGATALLHWPLLATAAAMAIAAWLDASVRRAHVLAPVALLFAGGVGQTLEIGHLLFLSVGGPLPQVALISLLMVALMGWPLLHRLVCGRLAWGGAALCLLAAVAIAAWVRFDPIAPSVPTYSVDKR